MKIGLVAVDGNGGRKKKWGATVYPNLALCKLSAWHKARGDEVEWALALARYDRVYMSKVFNFTPDDNTVYNASEVIRGGTGYDIHSKLPEDVDRTQPDYSIYPELPADTAYGFLTRGCPNKCPWCVVPEKEGGVRPYMDISEVATPTRRKLVLMDNNILALHDYAMEQFEKSVSLGISVDFNQAMDARLVTDDLVEVMARMSWIDSRIRFGCDTPAQTSECHRAIDALRSAGFNGRFLLYTIITMNAKESYDRIAHWRDFAVETKHLAMPYAQPWRDVHNANEPMQWQKDLAQWVNKKQLMSAISFPEFRPRKGFVCSSYFNADGEFAPEETR